LGTGSGDGEQCVTSFEAPTWQGRTIMNRRSRWWYAAIGVLLGAGAPVGALILRVALWPEVLQAPIQELQAHGFFYLYSLIGTCVVLGSAGFVAGLRAERLREAKAFYHGLSEHDAITGLLNARAFDDRYRRAVGRAGMSGQPLTILLLDVDHLKSINDRYGHEAGNRALVHVANTIRKCKRAGDDAARWGGDEFAILLESAGAEAAVRVAEAILFQLRETPMLLGDSNAEVRVTIGIASAVPRPSEDLFATADRALYEGKEGGRDQWRVGSAAGNWEG
jgi:diguanylate cyclase (GGDEF)-like protein